MAVRKTSFAGNPFLGLYAKASDRLAFVAKSAPKKFQEGVGNLGVDVFHASVATSPYVGIYFAMNSHGIVLPPFCEKNEIKEIREKGLEVLVVKDSRFCALGNNIACNDKGAIVNPDMPKELLKDVEETLGVGAVGKKIAGYKTVGMMVVATNKGWVAHNRIDEEEGEMLEKVFKVKGMNGTVNSGTAMVGLGIVANSNSGIAGDATSGFELGRIEQALDLTD
ncbi:MAG: translation initiation factor IF-6 [Candidatus Micrarchaeota archaeon]